jgi:hypothetical protein
MEDTAKEEMDAAIKIFSAAASKRICPGVSFPRVLKGPCAGSLSTISLNGRNP